ncbi:MAG TPA: FecR domain-containing protein [Polyangiaceae bacterium]|nr:FecR domain-containing protein [Polyangiaceae bacterium]
MTLPQKMNVRVEPLSDARWTRIERDLFAKLQETLPEPRESPPVIAARRVQVGWLAAAAAVLIALGAIVRPWGAYRSDLRMRLATADGESQFTVGESALAVAAHSLLMVGGDDERGVDVVLERGAVTCEVAPRRGRPPFRIDAGEVRIRVVGTRFTVTHSQSETSVDVDHGTVEVSAAGTVAVLHDGDHWPPRPAPLPPVVRDARPPAALASVPSSTAPPPSASTAPSHPSRKRVRGVAPSHAEPDADEVPPPEVNAPPPEVSPAPPATAPEPAAQQVFEDAARLERTNPDQAAAAYRRIAGGGGEWAPNALFALGRLQMDRGNRTEAARLLNEYLAAYPHGMNADDARELLRRLR